MNEKSGWDIDLFVKYEEKEKAVKIKLGKKYRRVGTHEPVRVICVDRKDPDMPYVGLYMSKGGFEGVACFHPNDGTIEEVPAVDWSKVKTDTPIWIRTSDNFPWHKRHFNRFEGERVHYWPDGLTSFTCSGTSPTNNATLDNCSLEEPK